jgi:hypothetical protein
MLTYNRKKADKGMHDDETENLTKEGRLAKFADTSLSISSDHGS